jgi:Domain of unknown function (DUF4062)
VLGTALFVFTAISTAISRSPNGIDQGPVRLQVRVTCARCLGRADTKPKLPLSDVPGLGHGIGCRIGVVSRPVGWGGAVEVRQILEVFLASPSDVGAERAAALGIVRSVNRSIAKLGWQVDLHLWEDVRGGAARPQERINPLVDTCDVFVGVLWKRWGTPTGSYSSGFLEEFARALKRRGETDRPEMLIYFRSLDGDDCADPGPQLRQVLDFKRGLEVEGSCHFAEVADAVEWSQRFQTDLTEYVVELYGQGQDTLPIQSPSQPSAGHEEGSGSVAEPDADSVPDAAAARAQVVGLLRAFASVMGDGGDGESVTRQPSPRDRARLAVFAASYVSEEDTGAVLGSHELNLLYLSRASTYLTAVEARSVCRSLVADGGSVLPGWYWNPATMWTRIRPKSGIVWYLLYLSLNDSHRDVRSSALQLLTEMGSPIPRALDRSAILERLLAVDKTTRDPVALRYLSRVGRLSDIQRIEALCDDLGLDHAEVAATCATIEVRTRPGRVFRHRCDGRVAKDATIDRALVEHSSAIASQAVVSALASKDAALRLLALRLARAKGALLRSDLLSLLRDKSEDVRLESLLILRERGLVLALEESEISLTPLIDHKEWSWTKQYPAMRTLFEVAHADWADSHLDWLDINAAYAYRALALRERIPTSKVRQDIRSGFNRIRDASAERWKASRGADAFESLQSVWRSYDGLMPDMFAAAAFEVLAAIGRRSDGALARRALREGADWRVQRAATLLLAGVASRQDVVLLAGAAEALMGSARESAIKTVMQLSRGSHSAAARLLRNGNSAVVVSALRHAPESKSTWVKPLARKLLLAESGDVRIAAVRFLIASSTRAELLELLDEYVSQRTYFYNVVCWLDRHLYSPQPLQSHYREALAKLASPKESESEDAIDVW